MLHASTHARTNTHTEKGGVLLVPLSHFLTMSLDLAELGLRGYLRDAVDRHAFQKYSSLMRG